MRPCEPGPSDPAIRCSVPTTTVTSGPADGGHGQHLPGDLAQNERIETLRKAVLALPPAYREVVVLCDLHERDYAEAASALGCAIGTVRSRLHRARALLAEKMRAGERCAV